MVLGSNQEDLQYSALGIALKGSFAVSQSFFFLYCSEFTLNSQIIPI